MKTHQKTAKNSGPKPHAMNLNVRISGSLSDYVAEKLDAGDFENVSEYIRSLIRQDKKLAEDVAFKKMQVMLQQAANAPEDAYQPLSAQDIFARN